MDELDKKYPATEYLKRVFNFSKQENEEMKPLQDVVSLVQTLLALGQIAQKAEDNYVAANVLKRLGVKESPDTKTVYDITKGLVTVYEPKFWCSTCNTKKAEFKYKDKAYCKEDIEKLKEQALKSEPVIEEPNKKRRTKEEK